MANTQGLCNSFKQELLGGIHAFGTTVTRAGTSADTFKGALYYASATLGPSTTAYTALGEVSASGSYSAGGSTITNANAVGLTSSTAYWTPSGNLSWTSFTATAFDTLLIYNSTQSNKAVGVFTFSSQTITSGTFTLTMPTNDSTNGLVRLA